MGGVRPATRFGQRQRDQRFPGDDARNPFARQFGAGMGADDLAVQRAQHLHITDIQIGMADFLDHNADTGAVQPQPAEFRRQVTSDQPQRSHLLNQRPINGTAFLARPISRRQFLADEAAGGVLDCQLFLGEPEFHYSPSHAAVCPPYNTLTIKAAFDE